jgi:hypothetical protein
MNMDTNNETFRGLGKTECRRMKRRWKEESSGLSLKAWARLQHPVGDPAFNWLQAKRKERKS